MRDDIWTYKVEVSAERLDLDGFDVEATDGSIGHVDEATYDVGASAVVVDTGPWIFGRKVVLPAGTIDAIDLDGRKIFVRMTKDQIKDSPEYDPETTDHRDPGYRERVGSYYDSHV